MEFLDEEQSIYDHIVADNKAVAQLDEIVYCFLLASKSCGHVLRKLKDNLNTVETKQILNNYQIDMELFNSIINNLNNLNDINSKADYEDFLSKKVFDSIISQDKYPLVELIDSVTNLVNSSDLKAKNPGLAKELKANFMPVLNALEGVMQNSGCMHKIEDFISAMRNVFLFFTKQLYLNELVLQSNLSGCHNQDSVENRTITALNKIQKTTIAKTAAKAKAQKEAEQKAPSWVELEKLWDSGNWTSKGRGKYSDFANYVTRTNQTHGMTYDAIRNHISKYDKKN